MVLEVRELAPGRYRVLVAYGTSKKLNDMRTGEFKVEKQDGAAFVLAGLEAGTKFSLQASVELDYSDEWFKPPPNTPFGECPKLGVLHATLMRRAAAAWGALNP